MFKAVARVFSRAKGLPSHVLVAPTLIFLATPSVAQTFNAVSAGDMSSTSVVLWSQIRNSDATAQMSAGPTPLKVEVSTDPNFSTIVSTYFGATAPDNGNTFKLGIDGLSPNTQYFYRFTTTNGSPIFSDTGTFYTTPTTNQIVPFKFAFTGDYDALYRPYSVLNGFDTQANPGSVGVRYFINLGDLIYERNANGSPRLPADPSMTPRDLNQFYRKYIEGQTGVIAEAGSMTTDPTLQQGNKQMLASVGVYSLLDNHELYDKYISGGAPINSEKENELCSDVGNQQPCLASASNSGPDFINQTDSFKTMQKAFYNTQATIGQVDGLNFSSGASPVISAPNDPRTDGTIQNFFSRSWGGAATYIQLDDRSYRDARMVSTAPAIADDPNRTMLGATQLDWFKYQLLDAEKSGAVWKIVAISTPIDQWDAEEKQTDLQYDNKSWIGGYNAERNEIIKFIADNNIKNVIFITTDDHVARATKLSYQPNGPNSGSGTGWSEVPGAFQLLAGPAGAGGPFQKQEDGLNDFQVSQGIVAAQDKDLASKGAPAVGLMGLPGLNNIYRENDPQAATSPQGADFVSATTFNYSTLAFDRFANLSVEYWGIDGYAPNTFPVSCASSPSTPNCTAAPRLLFGFSVDVPYMIKAGEVVSLTDADRHSFTGRVADPLFFNSKWTNRGVLDISRTSIGAGFANYEGDGSLVVGANTPLKINGVATLQGGSVFANVAPGEAAYLPTAKWTVLRANGGRTGTFNTAAFLTPLSFLTPYLDYSTTDVTLGFALTPFSTVAKNLNQRSVGNALTLAALGPVNALGAPILNALFLGNYQNAQAVMDTVSGSGLASVQSTAMQVGEMASSSISDQIAFWRSGEPHDATGVTSQEGNNPRGYMSYAPVEKSIGSQNPIQIKNGGKLTAAAVPRTFRAWGSMFGGGANYLSDIGRGSAASNLGFYGGLIGVDYQIQPSLLVGVAVGGSTANFSVGSLSTNGNLTGFHAGVYGAYNVGNSYIALNETFSTYNNQTSRRAGGYALMPYEQLTSGFGSTEFRTRLEVGHSLLMGGLKATPFVAAEYAAYQSSAFNEWNSLTPVSTFALGNNGQAISSLPTFVGLRLSNGYMLANGWRLAPTGSVAYVHEFFPQRQFTNILLSMPGTDFNVSGPRSTYNLVQTKVGAQLHLTDKFALFTDFQGEFSSMSQSYGGKAGMRYSW
jgi:phosphodiesterase/alkaline phosphatase D-like protein/uncharacterized protein with beta-barrel porin domain